MFTQMNADERRYTQIRKELSPAVNALTERVIGAAFAVANTLGHGFLEAVYRNALVEELRFDGLDPVKEKAFPVFYRSKQIGLYIADIVVENTVVVELKAVSTVGPSHFAQLLNYLKASRMPVGLLLNFGNPRLTVKRIIL